MGFFDFLFGRKNKTSSYVKNVAQIHSEQSAFEIKTFYKTKLECSLTPGELILIDWTNKTGRRDNFPGYFHYTFGIDAEIVQEELLKDGYFEQRKTLKHLKVPELKSILLDHQFPTAGKKTDLVSRIEENIDLNSLDIPITYILTDKSKELLNKNDGYVRAYHDKYFDMENYHIYKNRLPFNGRYRDVKWAYLNDESLKNTMAGDYGLLRNNRLAQYQQLLDEKKLADAFSFIVEVFLLDVSGLDNGYDFDKKIYYDNINVVPRILDELQSTGTQLNHQDYELAFNRACSIVSSLPAKHFLTAEDYYYLKDNILTATTKEIESYFIKYSKFKRKF